MRENNTGINSVFPAPCNLMEQIDGGGSEERVQRDFGGWELISKYWGVKTFLDFIGVCRLHKIKGTLFLEGREFFKCIFSILQTAIN